jgi:hypothetical protein
LIDLFSDCVLQEANRKVVVSSMFYVALDGQGTLEPVHKRNVLQEVRGQSEELGDFVLRFPKASTEDQKVSHLITYAPR